MSEPAADDVNLQSPSACQYQSHSCDSRLDHDLQTGTRVDGARSEVAPNPRCCHLAGRVRI